MTAAPLRPALRWFGGKWRLAPWVLNHFPRHDAYVEPYGGAASVLLRKPPVKLETWNDLHCRLVNFFTVLRERPSELIDALNLTPYARQEYDQAHFQHPDPLEDARRFFVLSGQGRAGAAGDPTISRRTSGWRYTIDPIGRNGSPPAAEFLDLSHLHAIAVRLKRVQIENDQATTVIARYDGPGTLHYVDPTYWDPVADLHSRYAHTLTEVDHVALAGVLHACAGMVVLSGRPSELYDGLFGGWLRVDRLALTDSGQMRTESLWMNPAASKAQRQGQLFAIGSIPEAGEAAETTP